MQVCLIFPPLVLAAFKTPYPSLPMLSGYLKANSPHTVELLDLNAEVIQLLIQRTQDRKLSYPPRRYERLRDWVFGQEGRMSFEEAEFRLLRALEALLPSAESRLSRYAQEKNHGGAESATEGFLNFWSLSFAGLRDILQRQEFGPLFPFMEERLRALIPREKPVLVGLSLAFFPQFPQALELAKWIKAWNPAALVIAGGPCIRLVSRNFERIPELFTVIDGFVEQEGETVLQEVADRLDNGQDWRQSRGITCREDGRIRRNPAEEFDLNRGACPDFSRLSFATYLFPKTAYLRGAVGCYYNQCAFCTVAFNRFRARKIDLLVEDIRRLHQEQGIRRVCFADEAIHFRRLEAIADALLAAGLRIHWGGSSRFEAGGFQEALVKKLKASGCRFLNFGLEAGTQRVNDLMHKGIQLEEVRRTVRLLMRHGIDCEITSIIGFPGETESEAQETVRFLAREGFWFQACLSPFCLNYGSRVWNSPDAYGIRKIAPDGEFFFQQNIPFEVAGAIPLARLLQIRQEYRVPGLQRQLRRLVRGMWRLWDGVRYH